MYNLVFFAAILLVGVAAGATESTFVERIVAKEAALTHSVIRLLRDQIVIFHTLNDKLDDRVARRTRKDHPERYDAIESILEEAKTAVYGDLRNVRFCKKKIKQAKALMEESPQDALAYIFASNEFLDEIVQGNHGTVDHLKSKLADEKTGLYSRKLKIGSLIDETPSILEKNLSRHESIIGDLESLSLQIAESMATRGIATPEATLPSKAS